MTIMPIIEPNLTSNKRRMVVKLNQQTCTLFANIVSDASYDMGSINKPCYHHAINDIDKIGHKFVCLTYNI